MVLTRKQQQAALHLAANPSTRAAQARQRLWYATWRMVWGALRITWLFSWWGNFIPKLPWFVMLYHHFPHEFCQSWVIQYDINDIIRFRSTIFELTYMNTCRWECTRYWSVDGELGNQESPMRRSGDKCLQHRRGWCQWTAIMFFGGPRFT